MATMDEVAEAAGVSTATVSRALSQPTLVAAATRRRILHAVETLAYAPNGAAKSLRTARTGKLLVTVPDIANPFFSLILQGIEDAAQRGGYAVLLGDTRHDPEREDRYARMLLRKEADGLIFLGHRLPNTVAAWARDRAATAPIVNGCEFSPRLGVPSAHIDNAAAAAEAMAHLYALGHRRIGIITGPLQSPLSRDRLRGVLACAAAQRARRRLAVARGDFSIDAGLAGAAQLFARRQPPTAIFCFNDEMALGVLEYAGQRGLRVPADLSVIGFDDIRFARYLTPPLTTIRQPMLDIGRETVRLLLAILHNHHARPASITLPYQLVIRASTAAPRP